MINIVAGILLSCIITIGIECSVASIFLLKKDEYKYIVIINIITNIILNVLYHLVILLNSNLFNVIYIVIGEIIVFYVESLYYKKHLNLNINKFLFSLILNSVSFLTGIIISF